MAEDKTEIHNELTTPGGVHAPIQIGVVKKLVVGRLALMGAMVAVVAVLAGVVAWVVLRETRVDNAVKDDPTVIATTTATTEPTTDEPTTAEPTTTTTEPTTTEPTTTAVRRTTTRPRPVPAPIEVWWEGSLKLRGDGGPHGGYYFDSPQPQAGFVGDIGYLDAGTVGADAVAEWRPDAPADQPGCAELLRSTVGTTRASARIGNDFCFSTRSGRVGYAEVTGTAPRDPLDPSITLHVVVWDLPR